MDDDIMYEHEIVTTIRVKFRTLNKCIDKQGMLEEYAYLTDFGDALIHNQGDDYPRVVEVSVIDDQVVSFNKEYVDA